MKLQTKGDRVFQYVIYLLSFLIAVFTLYPLIYVLSASVSNPSNILNGKVVLFPVDFTAMAYRRVFHSADILTGYKNTIIYSVTGTIINLILTVMAAFPLSRRDMKGNGFLVLFMTFTMFFSGGMIPNYLNIKSLGLLNTAYSILLPGAINVTNMLIVRNYFMHSIPGELYEAAEIDGCSPLRTLLSVMLPLSKSILVVIFIYYFVAHWNSYFNAMLYISKREKWPLQVFLRQILLLSQMGDMSETLGVDDPNTALLYASLKYAVIVVAAIPLLIVYPMVQRFFEKGIMMGSIKG